ncbi:MAG: FcoT family thioesterase [Gammaproteobacteria bacterium]
MSFERIHAPEVLSLLQAYKSECRYLQEAYFDDGTPKKAKGIFSLSESFYVDSTGHLNAVEILICFNQLAYIFFGELIRRSMLPNVSVDSLDEFKDIQLSNTYIHKIEYLTFKKNISPNKFEGEMTLINTKSIKNISIFEVGIVFTDSQNGKASGRFHLAGMKK